MERFSKKKGEEVGYVTQISPYSRYGEAND
jgi:hypothetical protein